MWDLKNNPDEIENILCKAFIEETKDIILSINTGEIVLEIISLSFVIKWINVKSFWNTNYISLVLYKKMYSSEVEEKNIWFMC